MAVVFVVAHKPSSLVRGVLRNALVEPVPCVFAGRLDARRISKLVEMLQDSRTDALVCASSGRSPTGIRMKSIGKLRPRALVELDGVHLASRQKCAAATSGAPERPRN